MADRLFGGTREDQTCEELNRADVSRQEQVRQLKTRLQEIEERRFNRELQYQSRTNPNFVVTSRLDQDR